MLTAWLTACFCVHFQVAKNSESKQKGGNNTLIRDALFLYKLRCTKCRYYSSWLDFEVFLFACSRMFAVIWPLWRKGCCLEAEVANQFWLPWRMQPRTCECGKLTRYLDLCVLFAELDQRWKAFVFGVSATPEGTTTKFLLGQFISR